MFQSPGAILFQLGPVTVRWYGVMFAIGFLLASALGMRLARKFGLDTEKVLNTAFCAFGGGVVGARLYYVLLNLQTFSLEPLKAFAIWTGGLSIHGGIIGGFLAGAIYCKLAKISILKTADVLFTVLPLAQSIGRWGNFFNSEAFGTPVDESFPLKLFIPPERRPPDFMNNSYFHPTFLYESAYDFLLFLILHFVLADKLRNYPGVISFLYIAGYSIGRLLIEPMRTDSLLAFGIPAAILTSAISLVVSLLIILFLVLSSKRKAAQSN
ncbi:MAG: prolipoprotein diacylglyceryl transferase [Leptolyngbya sp.]|nr:prolipoprotein diacylglyceryl transferase [Candidatus Melainabacteria bacterium]